MKPKIRINTRDMEIVSRVFQDRNLTYGEIGRQFSLSGSRVGQIVKNAQQQVRDQLRPRAPFAIGSPGIIKMGTVAYFTPGAPLPDLDGPISFTLPRKDAP